MSKIMKASVAARGTGPSAGRAWLTLLRAPNLLTVPGDPIAGFLLAMAAGFTFRPAEIFEHWAIPSWSWVLPGVAAALSLYAYGLIANDLFDFREDARERPDRPLPSGRIGRRAAIAVCVLLAGLGIALSGLGGGPPLAVGLGLAFAILLYNGVVKKIPVLGPLGMGLCRSLSLMLGAALAGWSGQLAALPVIWPAAVLGLYVAAVTQLARHETRTARLGWWRWLPALVAAVGFLGLGVVLVSAELASWWLPLVLGGLMAGGAAAVGRRLPGRPPPVKVQAAIGQWLRGLLFIQFSLVSLAWGNLWLPGLVVLMVWGLHRRLAKQFYAT